MIYNQSEFQVRCEWGLQGVAQLAPISDAVIIVDVLSFSTSVEIGVSRGAILYPDGGNDASAQAFADSLGAELAGERGGQKGYSLSPLSMARLSAGLRLVLPSPNGSALSLGTGNTPTFVGCLRNYRAIARAARGHGKFVAVIPAGERWRDGSLRPAFEDWVGAGAIISELPGPRSPEAQAAVAAFRAARSDSEELLRNCSSGKELIRRGFPEDVALAAEMDVSQSVPVLVDRAYRALAG